MSSKMENLRRSSKDTVGRFKPDGRCKKHPKHRQSPGVCSLCLEEKLAQILTSRKSKTTYAASSVSSASSLSSYDSSTSASSCASPVHRFRFTTEGSSSMSIFLLSAAKPGLAKSMSLAVFPRRRHHAAAQGSGSVVDNNIKSAKKGGFWSKFLHPKGKRKEDAKLMHSRSMKEKETIAS